MLKFIAFAAGSAALALAAPVSANPGKGHGANAHARHGAQTHRPTGDRVRGARDRGYAYGTTCPPGLARKNNGCNPPGQVKQMYRVGQRYDSALGHVWGYNQIPLDMRNRYGLSDSDRYYYDSGYLYRVDPKTMLIEQAINAILR